MSDENSANAKNRDDVVEVQPGAGQAAGSADERPAPQHGTRHEVNGSPVRSPADLEGDGSPGTSNPVLKQLPP